MPTLFTATARDRAQLQWMKSELMGALKNDRLPPDEGDIPQMASAVYVVKTPADGIDAMSFNTSLSKYEPGLASCDVHQVLYSSTTPYLEELAPNVNVHNIAFTSIAGNTWVIVVKDRYGAWLVDTSGGSSTSTSQLGKDGINKGCISEGWYLIELSNFGTSPEVGGTGTESATGTGTEAGACFSLCSLLTSPVGTAVSDNDCGEVGPRLWELPEGAGQFKIALDLSRIPIDLNAPVVILEVADTTLPSTTGTGTSTGTTTGTGTSTGTVETAATERWRIVAAERPLVVIPHEVTECCEDANGNQFEQVVFRTCFIVEGVACETLNDPCTTSGTGTA